MITTQGMCMGNKLLPRYGDLAVQHGHGWIAIFVFVLGVLLAGCSRSDPETALRQTIDEMHAAIQGRDAGALHQFLAEDFVGNDGLDRDGARRTAAALMLRHRNIGVTPGPLDVKVSDTHATVRFTVMLRGGTGMPLPESAQVYNVETGWRLDGDAWKLTSARWSAVM